MKGAIEIEIVIGIIVLVFVMWLYEQSSTSNELDRDIGNTADSDSISKAHVAGKSQIANQFSVGGKNSQMQPEVIAPNIKTFDQKNAASKIETEEVTIKPGNCFLDSDSMRTKRGKQSENLVDDHQLSIPNTKVVNQPDEQVEITSLPIDISRYAEVDIRLASEQLERKCELKRAHGIPFSAQSSRNGITIKDIVKARKIESLIHFSSYENLSSIMARGIVTRKDVQEGIVNGSINDKLRLDDQLGTVSVSVAFPNDRMFYKYRALNRKKGWVVLEIDPKVLWENLCAFCIHNAADSRISRLPIAERYTARTLEAMFDDDEHASRSDSKLLSCDPTDSQAEVLVFGIIDSEDIISLNFENHTLLNQCSADHPMMTSQINMKYFGTRKQARYGFIKQTQEA